MNYAPVKLFCPHPKPGTPGDITFWGVALVSLTLYFCLAPPYINTLITLFSSARPFYHTHFPLTPGLPRGGWGQNNLTSALIGAASIISFLSAMNGFSATSLMTFICSWSITRPHGGLFEAYLSEKEFWMRAYSKEEGLIESMR